MTTPPTGKPYLIGDVIAQTSKSALKKARKTFRGMNTAVKLRDSEHNGCTDKEHTYDVYAAHFPGGGQYKYDRKRDRYIKVS